MPEAFISRAVILAAGRGTRMGEMTDDVPKPMLSVRGKPMIQHIVEGLEQAGIRKFFIVVGYRHEVIENHFRGSRHDIQFMVQEQANGTGSAAQLAEPFTAGETFLLTFGDILCESAEYVSCAEVLSSNPACQATIAVKAVDDPWQGAAVYEEQGRIREIIEKPPKGTSTTRWNSAGFYAFRPIIFEYTRRLRPSPRHEYELTSALDNMLADGLELRISPIKGEWRDVGRPDDLAAVNR